MNVNQSLCNLCAEGLKNTKNALDITRNARIIKFMGSAVLTTTRRRKMGTYNVFANACEFGLIEANSAQEAKDAAAQIAGYKSESDMEAQLEQPSELVAEKVDD